MDVDIQRQRRILRITETFAEPGFISELRSGASLRNLRRFSVKPGRHGFIPQFGTEERMMSFIKKFVGGNKRKR